MLLEIWAHLKINKGHFKLSSLQIPAKEFKKLHNDYSIWMFIYIFYIGGLSSSFFK